MQCFMQNIKALCFMVQEKQIFKVFTIYLYVKLICPGRGQFDPRGHDLSKLGRGPLGNATCKISKLQVFWFILRRFFKVFPFGCHGNQSSVRISILLAILVEAHARNIHVKFQSNRASGL